MKAQHLSQNVKIRYGSGNGAIRQLRLPHSEVQTGLPILQPLRRNGMQVTLAKQHVVLAAYLDFGPILRIEQYSIVDLDSAYVAANGDHDSPGEPPADRHGCRDQDAAAAAPLPGFALGGDQDSIVQH